MAKVDFKCRYVTVDKARINRDARTVPLSFSSENPAVQIADGNLSPELKRAAGLKDGERYIEVLDHSPESVDLSMLNNGGALLDEHDEKDQIGVVERAEITASRRGEAVVRLSDHEKGMRRLGEMERHERPHVSVGYKYTRFLGNIDLGNGRTGKRFAWKGLEISSVAIPADETVGVERSAADLPAVDSPQPLTAEELIKNLSTEEKQRMRTLLAPDATAGQAAVTEEPAKVRAAALDEYRKRSKEITTIADTLTKDHPHMAEKIRSLTNEALAGDSTVADYQIRCMTEVLKAKPARQITMAEIGMTEDEQSSYSVLRGIQSCLKRGKTTPDGLEGEVHDALCKRSGVAFEGFGVPSNARVRHNGSRLQRDLQVGVFAQGGATVATNLQTPIIELLRNRMVTDKVGIVVMAGLEGNVAIPRQTGAATAYSLAESATLTKSTQALDQILLAPHRVGAYNEYTKQLLLQSSADVENFIRDDLMKVIALKWDALILNGTGGNSEPLGIINTPGVGSINFGAAATFAKLVSFETALATANADEGSMAYITTPSTRGVLKSSAKLLTGATTVAAQPLWENTGTPGEGMVNGYRALATNQVPNNLVLFGNWGDVVHGLYGGFDVIVNPYSRDTDAAVRITINTFGDVAVRHPQSFCVSSDAGNQ